MNINEFSEKHPVGTMVRYYPVQKLKKFKEVEIISKPWELGHGDIVVSVSGIRGGVSIENIELAL